MDAGQYLAKVMTDGSERPKDLTLIAKTTVASDSTSIAICLNNEVGMRESNFDPNNIAISYKIYEAGRNPQLNVAPTCA